jgi:NADH:ubiquinone oxidoreductase subunit 5 (subunit L)/multisubunit Na+/H+ antiporter MnhA subunit
MNTILKFLFTIIFFVIITPLGLIIRLFGIDYLDQKLQTERKSYWIKHK